MIAYCKFQDIIRGGIQMSSVLTQPRFDPELHALDPELPFLASEAAVDIDNLLSGSSMEDESVRRLAGMLNNSLKEDVSENSLKSFMDMDPATVTILGTAVIDSSSEKVSLQKVDDLLDKASQFAKLLSRENLLENRGELEKARDFCIALSRSVVAYRKSIYDLRPSHPFRK
jgi:hypothetical protein